MSCNSPLEAYRTPSGEVKLGPCPGDGRWMELPCGRCFGCKGERARMWTVRILHEAQCFNVNWFLTLTYSPQFLPSNRSLYYGDFQAFMKRLRRADVGVDVGPDGGRPVRFFCAGEYGKAGERPHFHAILFNAGFKDMRKFANGTWHSAFVEEKLWQRGNVVIGDVSGQSAAYVAGYCFKKKLGASAKDHYEDVVDPTTGEVSARRPEFVVMSRRPGIGAWWYRKFAGDLFPHDFAVAADGQKYKVPRYYWKRYKDLKPAEAEEVAYKRFLRATEKREESTPERRAVKEEYAIRKQRFYDSRNL